MIIKLSTVGKTIVADSLSRLPLPKTETTEYVEDYVKKVLLVQTHDLQALTIDVIKEATEQDQQLQQLIRVVQTNQWLNPVEELT